MFAALQYLRKVCNHPLLALTPSHPLHQKCEADARPIGGLHALACSPKLLGLRQLLLECGIGVDSEDGGGDAGAGGKLEAETAAVATHRALVFCQSSAMLDLIESDLLKAHMPSVSYLRLDGRVAAKQRFGLASQFNKDPSIDLMLLTTSVGGLGLNLTAADVVIFVDHDWNPMKDLQAMDRAHRIGQTKVVTVYRLVTRGTLEEKIMNLQAFKLHVANSVVNRQNAALATMNTEELLDLFHLSPGASAARTTAPKGGGGGSGQMGDDAMDAAEAAAAVSTRGGQRGSGGSGHIKGILDGVGELWGAEQYEEEYDLDNFLATLS